MMDLAIFDSKMEIIDTRKKIGKIVFYSLFDKDIKRREGMSKIQSFMMIVSLSIYQKIRLFPLGYYRIFPVYIFI